MKKVVLLGCENSHADTFAKYIRHDEAYSDVEMIGAYSTDTKAMHTFCEKYQVRPMARYDEDVGQVDGILVTARHGEQHVPFALPYFRAGLAAFIDKPITIREDDAEVLVRAAEEKGVRLTGGSSVRFHTVISSMQNDVKNRTDGETVGGFLRFPLSMFNRYGGFYFYAQHLVESVGYIFGYNPRTVQAFRSKKAVTVVFRYESYDVVGVGSDESYRYYAARLTASGTKGQEFVLDDTVFRQEFDAFYALLHGEEQKISGQDFIAPVYVMNAVFRSLESGREEPVRCGRCHR